MNKCAFRSGDGTMAGYGNTTASGVQSELSSLLRGIKPRRPAKNQQSHGDLASKGNEKDPECKHEVPKKQKVKVKVVGDGLSNTSKVGVQTFDELAEKKSLRVPQWLARGASLTTNGAEELTPIQSHAIPAAIEGRDLLAIAPTGSGKTLSFLVPSVALAVRVKRIERNKELKRRQSDLLEIENAPEEDKSQEGLGSPSHSPSTSSGGANVEQALSKTKGKGPYAVLLAPTRELASQTARELRRLLSKTPKKKRLQVLLLTQSKVNTNAGRLSTPTTPRAGETETETREEKVESGNSSNRVTADIVVATPPRLAQLIKHKEIKLSRVRMLVLDEADKLFGDDTFLEHIDCVMTSCTHKRLRRCVYTATLPEMAEDLLRNVMQQPVRITVGERNAANSSVKQSLVFCGEEGGKQKGKGKGKNSEKPQASMSGKLSAIRQLVSAGDFVPPVLLFVQSKDRAAQLYQALRFDGINIDVIHADRTPKERARAIQNFRAGTTWILITTDLMARGMDILGVNTVVNFDCPVVRSDYVHRVGRTGRAGRTGKCITFYTEEDFGSLHMIASCMKTSGSEAPEWMLKLPRRHGGQAKKALPPKRSDIIDQHMRQQEGISKNKTKKKQWARKNKDKTGNANKKQKTVA